MTYNRRFIIFAILEADEEVVAKNHRGYDTEVRRRVVFVMHSLHYLTLSPSTRK